MKARFGLIAIVGSMLALGACGSEEVEPNVTIDNLVVGQTLSGTVEVEVTAVMWADVVEVQLLARDLDEPLASSEKAPFTLAWDTSAGPLGGLEVFALATDADGNEYTSPAVLVAVVGVGELASMLDDSTGDLMIPADYNGTQEIDARHHWNTPAGIHTIVAIAEWFPTADQDPWDVEVTVGTGICPHSGVVLSDAPHGIASPIVLTTTAAADAFEETQFFVHLKPMNPLDHLGESVPYRVQIFLVE